MFEKQQDSTGPGQSSSKGTTGLVAGLLAILSPGSSPVDYVTLCRRFVGGLNEIMDVNHLFVKAQCLVHSSA